jgi:Cys-tRNA(Pro)/Cys-tRNA(Cys) deacylase
MRSCSDVHNCLLEQGVAHEIVHLPALSSTARRTAALLGVPLREVVTCVLLETERGPVVCLVPGDAHVDRALVRAELGCDRVTPVTADRVVALTGYRPGALPPCGLAADLPAVADAAVFELPVVYCGGGTTTTVVKLRSADLRDALGVRVAAIAARPQNGAVARG